MPVGITCSSDLCSCILLNYDKIKIRFDVAKIKRSASKEPIHTFVPLCCVCIQLRSTYHNSIVIRYATHSVALEEKTEKFKFKSKYCTNKQFNLWLSYLAMSAMPAGPFGPRGLVRLQMQTTGNGMGRNPTG